LINNLMMLLIIIMLIWKIHLFMI